jgi:hypothetical protein
VTVQKFETVQKFGEPKSGLVEKEEQTPNMAVVDKIIEIFDIVELSAP